MNEADIAMAEFEAAARIAESGDCIKCGGAGDEMPYGNFWDGYHDECARRIVAESKNF